jgi:hypothetical protein
MISLIEIIGVGIGAVVGFVGPLCYFFLEHGRDRQRERQSLRDEQRLLELQNSALPESQKRARIEELLEWVACRDGTPRSSQQEINKCLDPFKDRRSG